MIVFDGKYRWPEPGKKTRRSRKYWPHACDLMVIDLAAAQPDLPHIRSNIVVVRNLQPMSTSSCAENRGLAVCRDFNLDYRHVLWVEYDNHAPARMFVAGFEAVSYSPEGPTCTVTWRPITPNERAVLNFIQNYLPEKERAYLFQGNYDISYLDYDWSLNEQK